MKPHAVAAAAARAALAASALVVFACGPTVAARGAMGLGWMRDGGPPARHGVGAFGEVVSEIGRARADPDACALAGAIAVGGEMSGRTSTDPGGAGDLRYDVDLAISAGGGAVVRCGRFVARLLARVSPLVVGDFKGTPSDPQLGSRESSVGWLLGGALDALAAPRPGFRAGVRLSVERVATYAYGDSTWSVLVAAVLDWGTPPPGAN